MPSCGKVWNRGVRSNTSSATYVHREQLAHALSASIDRVIDASCSQPTYVDRWHTALALGRSVRHACCFSASWVGIDASHHVNRRRDRSSCRNPNHNLLLERIRGPKSNHHSMRLFGTAAAFTLSKLLKNAWGIPIDVTCEYWFFIGCFWTFSSYTNGRKELLWCT